MLRRKDDMKDWQKGEAKQEPIQGIKTPDGIPVDDAPEIPDGFIPEMKPKRRAGRPKKEKVESAEEVKLEAVEEEKIEG